MEKRKLWPWFVGGFLVLIVVAVGAARAVLGYAVASDEFRGSLNTVLERAVRTVLPAALTEVGRAQLTGVLSLELADVSIRSGKRLGVVVHMPRAKITPQLLSFLLGSAVKIDADALLDGGGRIAVRGGLVSGAFAFLHRSAQNDSVKLEGTLTEVNAVTPVSLFLAEHQGPNVELAKGTLTGTFTLDKPFGVPEDAGKKAGRLVARLDESTWVVGGEKARTLEVPPLDVDLALEDYLVRIMKPIAFTERTGRATIAGALHLPVRKDREPSWELDVLIDGDQGLGASLARILRCRAPEKTAGFKVVGKASAPDCPSTGT